MRIVIYNNKGKRKLNPDKKGDLLPDPKLDACEFLRRRRSTLPVFTISKEKEYDGIVVYVDDDDAEGFTEIIETAGFSCEAD